MMKSPSVSCGLALSLLLTCYSLTAIEFGSYCATGSREEDLNENN